MYVLYIHTLITCTCTYSIHVHCVLHVLVSNYARKHTPLLRPSRAAVGDVIVLTKALGTQIAVNAHQWMEEVCPHAVTIE